MSKIKFLELHMIFWFDKHAHKLHKLTGINEIQQTRILFGVVGITELATAIACGTLPWAIRWVAIMWALLGLLSIKGALHGEPASEHVRDLCQRLGVANVLKVTLQMMRLGGVAWVLAACGLMVIGKYNIINVLIAASATCGWLRLISVATDLLPPQKSKIREWLESRNAQLVPCGVESEG